jgi:hypothetical protein
MRRGWFTAALTWSTGPQGCRQVRRCLVLTQWPGVGWAGVHSCYSADACPPACLLPGLRDPSLACSSPCYAPNPLPAAVSDLEVEYTEEAGTLYYFKYPVAGGWLGGRVGCYMGWLGANGALRPVLHLPQLLLALLLLPHWFNLLHCLLLYICCCCCPCRL